jgi:hypothetical protein
MNDRQQADQALGEIPEGARYADSRAVVWALLALESELGALHETVADELLHIREALEAVARQGAPVELTVTGDYRESHLEAIRDALETIAQQGPGVIRAL